MAQKRNKKVAVVQCLGGCHAEAVIPREGLTGDCRQILADHPDGILKCKWGCLGMGSCVTACKMDAIHINGLGIADPHKQLWSSGGGPGQMCGLRPVRESLSTGPDTHYHAGISDLSGMYEPGCGSPDKEGLLGGLYCLRHLCKELSGGCRQDR